MRPLTRPGRRRILALAAAVPLTAAAAIWAGPRLPGLSRREPMLLSEGLVVGPGGGLYPLVSGSSGGAISYVPGTRLPRGYAPQCTIPECVVC